MKKLWHLEMFYLSLTPIHAIECNSMKFFLTRAYGCIFKSCLHEELFDEVLLRGMLIYKVKRLLMHQKYKPIKEMSPMLIQKCYSYVDSHCGKSGWLIRSGSSGCGYIQISWVLRMDPRVHKVEVHWDSGLCRGVTKGVWSYACCWCRACEIGFLPTQRRR